MNQTTYSAGGILETARRALAIPPSSTEGTSTLKANFDGCPFCGMDDHAGPCEGSKEVEG